MPLRPSLKKKEISPNEVDPKGWTKFGRPLDGAAG
jgi:hypothetical protein